MWLLAAANDAPAKKIYLLEALNEYLAEEIELPGAENEYLPDASKVLLIVSKVF